MTEVCLVFLVFKTSLFQSHRNAFVLLVNVVTVKPFSKIMFCFSLKCKVPILANYFFTFSFILTADLFLALRKFNFQDHVQLQSKNNN